MKILDSDHCVANLRAQLDLTRFVAPDEELAITSISVGELVHGAVKSQRASDNLARLDVLLSALSILPYDEWSARRFGNLRRNSNKPARLSVTWICRSPASL